jgi:hypothetical protein
MKTIKIGKFGRGHTDVTTLNYDRVTARIIPVSDTQPRPQYFIELSGRGTLVNLYASSPAAHEKLMKIVVDPPENSRLVPGSEMLGVHIHYDPQGWDSETVGRVAERRAPGFILELAPGGLPDKPRPLHPFPEKPGIEVFGSGRSNGLVYYMSYNALEKVVVRKNIVRASFQPVSSKFAFTELMVETASEDLAARLAASMHRKTSRRLVINNCVTGIILVVANAIEVRLGSCA